MERIMLISGFLPLPFVLYAIVQTLRKRPYANLFGVLLAYLAVLIPVGMFAWGTASQSLPSLLTLIIVASAAITFLFGFILFVRELRQPQRKVSLSYGLLGIGVSALLAIGLIVTPTVLALIPNATANAAASGAMPFPAGGTPGFGMQGDAVATTSSTSDTSAQVTPSGFPAAPAGFSVPVGFSVPAESTAEAEETVAIPTNTPAPTATRENVRQAVLPTITPTLAVTATPLATATSAPITCNLLTVYNLNLRAEPSTDAELLTTIPYGTTITAYEMNDDGWWRVEFHDIEGWVSGEYVSVAAACSVISGN